MKKRILVVDDEPDMLKVTLLRLAKSGYETIGGRDGLEALELIRAHVPDLIILDLYLPGLNGDEVVKVLKKDKKLKQIPVILVSATVRTLKERAAKCGADAFFTKLFDLGELLTTIKKLAPPDPQ